MASKTYNTWDDEEDEDEEEEEVEDEVTNDSDSDDDDEDDEDDNSQITLYHYTTKAGLKGIERSCVIRQSKAKGPNRDAAFGDGVYLTSLSPKNPTIILALNNWDGSANYAKELIQWGKVKCYIQLDIDRDDVEEIEDEYRDIYLYHGDLEITEDMNPVSGLVSKTK